MNILGKIQLLALLAVRGLFIRPGPPLTLDQRLAAMPCHDLPLNRPASIRWNTHQVPYIESEDDEDLAFCFGLVHAHLRLGQIELLRRAACGRLAELGGTGLVAIDHLLRALDFPRAGRAMLSVMPQSTLAWLTAYVGGLNHYIGNLRELPHELALFGAAADPWKLEDVAAVARLSAADANWPVWFQLLKHRDGKEWPALWSALMEGDFSVAALPELDEEKAAVARLAIGSARTGSNAFALSGGLTSTGKPILAADPHLALSLPNTWILAGARSPGFHAVGLMLPGLPFIASGRNPWIAWGGTSLHAATSDLVDVSQLPNEAFKTRVETIKVRWAGSRNVSIRESPHGPVITDCGLLPVRRPLALRWQGHRASDEFTAMLKLNRARDWREFTSALEDYGVPGLTMVYADAAGNVGRTMAVKLPKRPAGLHPDIIVPPSPERDWQGAATSRSLPSTFNPPRGFVASANDRPVESAIEIGHFFSATDRLIRVEQLIAQYRPVGPADIGAFQCDVIVPAAVALRDILMAFASRLQCLSREQESVLGVLVSWDGRYAADSQGALAFEFLLHRLAVRFYRGTSKFPAYRALWNPYELIRRDLVSAGEDEVKQMIGAALAEAATALAGHGSWGEMHRLEVKHLFSALPLIGRRYRFADLPAAGSSETLMKTAHPSTDTRHAAIYGSNARQICDMSDMDANSFVLLGGEDGWLGSSTFLDQLDLWRERRYITMPMTRASIAAQFSIEQQLVPRRPSEAHLIPR